MIFRFQSIVLNISYNLNIVWASLHMKIVRIHLNSAVSRLLYRLLNIILNCTTGLGCKIPFMFPLCDKLKLKHDARPGRGLIIPHLTIVPLEHTSVICSLDLEISDFIIVWKMNLISSIPIHCGATIVTSPLTTGSLITYIACPHRKYTRMLSEILSYHNFTRLLQPAARSARTCYASSQYLRTN